MNIKCGSIIAVALGLLVSTSFAQLVDLPAKPAAPAKAANAQPDFVEHQIGESGMTLRAPKNWQKTELATAGVRLNLVADEQGSSVSLVVSTLSPGETLDNILKGVADDLARVMKDFKLESSTMVDLNGERAGRIVYGMSAGPEHIKVKLCQFVIVQNETEFVLTCTARDGVYANFIPVAEQVAATLSIPPGLASFGEFDFDLPKGWTRGQPDRQKTAASVLLNGTAWNNADGLLKVDAGRSTKTPADMAQLLAGKDGTILPNPVKVDGVDGIRVETPSTDMSRPRYAVILVRNGMGYMIAGAGKKDADVAGAFDHMLATWHWTSPAAAAPAQHKQPK